MRTGQLMLLTQDANHIADSVFDVLDATTFWL